MFAPFSADKGAAEEVAKKIKKEEEDMEDKKAKKRKSKEQGGRDAVKCYSCQRIGHKAYECPDRENQRQADRQHGFDLARVIIDPRLDALELGQQTLEDKLKKEKKEAEKRAEKAEKKVEELKKKVTELGEKIANMDAFLAKLPALLKNE